jgi:hypothetical protein
MGNRGRENHQAGNGGIVEFSEDILSTMDGALAMLLEETGSRCAFVIDRTGCILSASGDFHPIGRETMGATAAGVIAALNTMVAQAVSPEVSIKLYGSEVDKVHFYVIADRLVLGILQTRSSTTGTVRNAARSFAQTISPLLARDRAEGHDTQRVVKSVQYIESKLDDIFKDMM